MPIAAMAAAMGGNVRVGLEDSLWIGPGQLAESNAAAGRLARQIIEGLGLDIATPRRGARDPRPQRRRPGRLLTIGGRRCSRLRERAAGIDARQVVMSSPDVLLPSFYRHWIEDRVRFADLDPLGHCNNAAIGGFFESSRVALFTEVGQPISGGDLSVVIVRIEIDFRREIHYGARVRVGARVLKIGRTSLTLAGAVFDGDRCAATAQVVAVLFDLAQRRSVEIPTDLRQALAAYA